MLIFGDVSADFNSGRISPSNDFFSRRVNVSKVLAPNDHGLLSWLPVTVYRAFSRYKYDVTVIFMTSSTFDFCGRLLTLWPTATVYSPFSTFADDFSFRFLNDESFSNIANVNA